MKIKTVAKPTYVPITKYLNNINPEINGSSFFLGGLFITFGSTGLNDKAVAGKPSVTKFTQSNYILLNPSGIPNKELKNILKTSPILEDII